MFQFENINNRDAKCLLSYFERIDDLYKSFFSTTRQYRFANQSIILNDGTSLPLLFNFNGCVSQLEFDKEAILENAEFSESEKKYFLRLNEKKLRFLKSFYEEFKDQDPLQLFFGKVAWGIIYILILLMLIL